VKISSSHIQHVINAYRKKLGRNIISDLQHSDATVKFLGRFVMSNETKRKLLVEQITRDIVSRVQEQMSENNIDEVAGSGKEFADLLNAEFRFRVIGGEDGGEEGVVKKISINDLKRMIEDIFEVPAIGEKDEKRHAMSEYSVGKIS